LAQRIDLFMDSFNRLAEHNVSFMFASSRELSNLIWIEWAHALMHAEKPVAGPKNVKPLVYIQHAVT
jgi:hypothetical protein